LAAITNHSDFIPVNQYMLVHISEQLEQHIEALAQDLLSLTYLLETLIKLIPTLMFARLYFQLSSIEDRVEVLIDTIQPL
jgi:hypothetical protein